MPLIRVPKAISNKFFKNRATFSPGQGRPFKIKSPAQIEKILFA